MAKDIYHAVIKKALEKDGWTITDDPLTMYYESERVYIDLGAERLLAAEKGTIKIAVEVKSFLGASSITDFHQALGQYSMYMALLELQEPERILILAVPYSAKAVFERPIIQLLIQRYQLQIMMVDTETEVIIEWNPNL